MSLEELGAKHDELVENVSSLVDVVKLLQGHVLELQKTVKHSLEAIHELQNRK